VTTRDEDDAWRSIVDNYGERPQLDDLETPDDPEAPEDQPGQGDHPEPEDKGPLLERRPAPDHGEPAAERPRPAYVDPEDRFVPPTPPPVPRPHGVRAAAWAGLAGSPALMLLCVVLGIDLPGVLDLALVASFVAGFVYLMAKLPRGRDPWDDGSRV
jgi:hypothetical protein